MERLKAYVTPSVMKWARERACLTLEAAAQKIGRSEDEVAAWEAGELLPSLAQARKAAEVYKRSLAIFYLPEPPQDFQTLTDFRTLASAELATYSPELAILIRRMQSRQEWLREYRVAEKYEPLEFIGSATIATEVAQVVREIRRVLGLNLEDQWRCRDSNELLNQLIASAESVGICICRDGTVEPEEVRGIALPDDIAPFVFLNSKDSQTGRLFSFAHEIAHLWINQSGISNQGAGGSRRASRGIEAFCNRVASTLLLDPVTFQSRWRATDATLALSERIDAVAKSFKVSGEVVARRLLDKQQITEPEYEQLHALFQERWIEQSRLKKLKQKEATGGPNPILLRYHSNGRGFTQSVLAAASVGSITLRDASLALGVKINHLSKLAATAGLAPIHATAEG